MRGDPEPVRPSVRDLLAGVIDYAGLFPPAGLGMEAAAREYDAARRGPQGWMLGRFAVPARRLVELGKAAAELPGAGSVAPWFLTAIGGDDTAGDLEAIRGFRERRPRSLIVDTYETRRAEPAAIAPLMRTVPAGLTVYVELPFEADPAAWMAAIARAGARAKLRAGGVTAERFPSSRAVAAFLAAGALAGVPFKATAGLHHALRSVQPLGGAAGEASALMHGLLNVLLAAALASDGAPSPGGAQLEELLEERSPAAFRFEPDAVTWRGHRIAGADLRAMRRHRLVAVGSCSFDEPAGELKRMGVL